MSIKVPHMWGNQNYQVQSEVWSNAIFTSACMGGWWLMYSLPQTSADSPCHPILRYQLHKVRKYVLFSVPYSSLAKASHGPRKKHNSIYFTLRTSVSKCLWELKTFCARLYTWVLACNILGDKVKVYLGGRLCTWLPRGVHDSGVYGVFREQNWSITYTRRSRLGSCFARNLWDVRM